MDVNRRHFINIAATGGIVSLAGCGGGDDSGSGGSGSTASPSPEPTSLSDSTLSLPSSVEFGAALSVEVSVTNTGDITGVYEGTLRTNSASVDLGQDVSMEVPGGETATTEIRGIELPELGTYTFQLEDDLPGQAEGEVTVDPGSPEIGETGVLRNDLAVTINSAEADVSFFTSDSSEREVWRTAANSVAVLFEFSVAATSDSRPPWSDSYLTAVNGTLVTDDAPELRDYEYLPNREVSSGAPLRGYVMGVFGADAVTDGIQLELNTDPTADEPEQVYDVSTGLEGLPEHTVTSIDAPSDVDAGAEYRMSVTFENVGDGAGTAKGILQYYTGGYGDNWAVLDTATPSPLLEADVEPGETATIEVANSSSIDGDVRYRVAPWNEEFTINYS